MEQICQYKVGNRIVYDGFPGTLVAIIEKNEYYSDYYKAFEYLKKGIVIKDDKVGTIYIDNYDEKCIMLESDWDVK